MTDPSRQVLAIRDRSVKYHQSKFFDTQPDILKKILLRYFFYFISGRRRERKGGGVRGEILNKDKK